MNRKHLGIMLIVLAAAAFGVVLSNPASAENQREIFSHSSARHRKMNCAACHKIPTGNWVSARGYPDVADYPDHDSCVGCHRNDFFRGNFPTICAVCHVDVRPRGQARFPFPEKRRNEEFETIFPHDVHQDIIARNERRRETAVVHFVNAGFRKTDDDDDAKSQFNNCAICHQTATVLPEFATLKPLRTEFLVDPAPETFAPKAAFFKDMPTGHASCFSCHYQGQKPVRTDCAGCHRLTTPYFEDTIVRRFSLRYDHSSKNHVNKDCTVCHIRITQTSDLRNMINADVPLLTCSSSACHLDKLTEEVSIRQKSIEENKEVFQCNYCHTYAIGSYKIPANHLEQAQ